MRVRQMAGSLLCLAWDGEDQKVTKLTVAVLDSNASAPRPNLPAAPTTSESPE